MTEEIREQNSVTRRSFLRTAAASTGVILGAVAHAADAGPAAQQQAEQAKTDAKESTQPLAARSGKEVLKVGIIGAGGRGTGAAINALEAHPAVVIAAIGDLFEDRVKASHDKIAEKFKDRLKATPETCFHGWDCCQKVLATDVDYVILATPPGFRPAHLKAAVEAGKHVFTEKPVAVDPVGCRSVMETGQLAQQKGLCVVAGTQRRHSPNFIETIQRIKDGAIGEIVAGECFWCQEGLWHKGREPQWTDMEWQIRNWLYFDWLSGDHIVEQHVHNLDVIQWVMGATPVKCFGMGGRQERTDPKYGNIYDHFAVEYEYPNGARVTSMCRQIVKAGNRHGEFVIGTKGTANPDGKIFGPQKFEYDDKGKPVNPLVQEHRDLIDAIMEGRQVNEVQQVAESTMVAIMGRMSAYTGQSISWKWIMNASKLDLTPAKLEFGPIAVNPVPIPGQMQLV